MATSYAWNKLAVFLSSSFKDLELQRDELAKIFNEVKQKLFDRQLFFDHYDLRWRKRHESQDVVKWCMEMVERSDYFIGIIGYRYGYRPIKDGDDKFNINGMAITEMEIRHAINKIDKKKCFFLFSNIKYDSKILTEEEKKNKG